MGMWNCYRGQGATEYLVLLAVVLIVALVSVALLGFFPGMASDAQITQSQMYWSSTSPITVVEGIARYSASWGTNSPTYLRFRNNGAYPIRITKLIGGTNASFTSFYCQTLTATCSSLWQHPLRDYYYFAPGEEKYMGGESLGLTGSLLVIARDVSNSIGTDYTFSAAAMICQSSSTAPGTIVINNFGFEYIMYLDNNQQITKRFIGAKPLIIKCREPG